MPNGIRDVETEKTLDGSYQKMRVAFGPHYFLELHSGRGGKVTFILGATHHGFKADASEVNGELEKIINQIRQSHPGNLVD